MPLKFECSELQDDESVFIPSLGLRGTVISVDNDKAFVQYKEKETNCTLTYEKDYGSISKKDLVDQSFFTDIEEINYYIDKLGFSDSMFNSGSDKILACLKPYLVSAKSGGGSEPQYKLENKTP
jgi:hypothetical protein